jgi:HEAT repeat protein
MGPAYGLATQLSADTPQIRAALREPLDDPDEETREEAVCGLAKRRDEVAFEPLLEYLRSGFAGTGCIDAAGAWGPTVRRRSGRHPRNAAERSQQRGRRPQGHP